ncbi:RidA family protein [Pseudoroseomonas wenyumeiae]|jgi:enamine deaminase RidA (YjgF/YER057c/UK114 family)|uniref:RidA family protein n=2 Tax=Acetobacterales TaxID=3120395 RepID=A0A3A9J5C5_9PROT|nr:MULTISPECIES: RidA family protein [Pseudoroseomonas]MBC9178426.1 RidA family protein [Pseudoroseomonas ludipueritiae]MCG7363978.1 RidA family protein [Roseomonas sp. ACRSG]RKK01090.1 RidA family protein [Pseudoroseomonas wenyumeiae]RMI26652.1 RidA family protein [Pseudoroseomonas wenyumeiae]
MTGTVEGRLAALGITLPTPAAPIANYVGFNFAGPNLLVVSGQIPLVEGKIACTGKVGAGVSVEQATAAARICLINVVAQVKAAVGDLDRVKRVVRLGGFIAAGPEFTQHALVMNGASDLAVEVFGEAGRHARSTIGVPSLPGDAAVEVEGMFEIA